MSTSGVTTEIKEVLPVLIEGEKQSEFCSLAWKCKVCSIDHLYFMKYSKQFPVFCSNCFTLILFEKEIP